MADSIRFKAEVVRSGNSLGWTIAYVPRDLKKLWGTGGQVRVKGAVNGFAFGTSLFPDGKGRHFMIVNKTMQRGGKTAAGMTAEFELQRDEAPRTVEMPPELLRELKQERSLRTYFDGLNHATRNDIARYVSQPKSEEARRRRAEKIAERLMTAMMGENGELPPVLLAAFRQNPIAREGWERMPTSKRRFQLFGITGYQSAESRAKRLQNALEEMVGYARKTKGQIGRG